MVSGFFLAGFGLCLLSLDRAGAVESPAERARELLAVVEAHAEQSGGDAALTRPVGEAQRALARSEVEGLPERHRNLLEQLAFEWASVASDWLRTREAELSAARVETELSRVQTELVRSRAAVEQARARIGRAQSELDSLSERPVGDAEPSGEGMATP